ncbi:MAG: hypothetical protein Q7S66_04020 [bacterium]|nr:hypothetical protein [bacterium]
MAHTKTTHKDIRKLLSVLDRRYEAVGFLEKGELRVDSGTMLSRTKIENGGVIGGEDQEFLKKHRAKLGSQIDGYRLIIGSEPGISWLVWYLYKLSSWSFNYFWSDEESWGIHDLVVRRLP